MGRMKTIQMMIEEGSSIHEIAGQLQKWNPNMRRKDAITLAFRCMQDWRELNEESNDS